MADEWVLEEMGAADLKDGRLNARLKEVLTQLGRRPAAAIPAACAGLAEMTAAYRFFDNPKVGFKAILAAHVASTQVRVAAQRVVVVAQDSTEIDLTRPAMRVEGAGPLDGGTRRGLLLHTLHAFTPDGTPLGTLDAMCWAREDPGPRAPTRAKRARTPIERKESFRWLRARRKADDVAGLFPGTQVVCVGDSESDIYEFLVEPGAADWIVRACYDRVLVPEADAPDADAHLRQRLFECPVIYQAQVAVRGRTLEYACDIRARRQPRKSRQATVEVRATTLTLSPPRRRDRVLPPVTINVVLVTELGAPPGDVPVEWMLLTSLPVGDTGQVRTVVEYYCVRWMIEVFFRILKSGCRVEKRRFEHADRIRACLAVYLIVAWRTLYVCRLARTCPDLDCEAIFEPTEWKAVWKVVQRSDPPRRPPPLGAFVSMLASLGGYVARKGSPPGPQTVWIGLQRAYDFALCWSIFGPEAKKTEDV